MSLLATQAASREYANRPADERFASIPDLIASAQHQKDLSKTVTYNAKDLRAVAVDANPENPQAGSVMLESPRGRASFTHYSFGQLAQTVGAPGGYLRSLPPAVAADCLNAGLKHTPPGTDLMILAQAANGSEPKIRAVTSENYGRVWDADLYRALDREILQRLDENDQPVWTTPPTWTGEPAGAYRGDRDSFVVVVNGGSIVNDPSLSSAPTGIGPVSAYAAKGQSGPTNGMFRGLLIRNSEVGAAAITIEQILFRYICGNHMLWGAIVDKTFKRRHVGEKTMRDTIREIGNIAYRWTNASASRDEAIIKSLIDHEIAHTEEAVIDELRKIGFTKDQAKESIRVCVEKENASPRSFWGVAQGATRLSQESGYQDSRLIMDLLAAKVLQRGAKQFA